MPLTQPLRLKGAPGSPYTRKMLAYMRYRHISYELLIGDHSIRKMGLPTPKVDLLPTFYLPNEQGEVEAIVDLMSSRSGFGPVWLRPSSS